MYKAYFPLKFRVANYMQAVKMNEIMLNKHIWDTGPYWRNTGRRYVRLGDRRCWRIID